MLKVLLCCATLMAKIASQTFDVDQTLADAVWKNQYNKVAERLEAGFDPNLNSSLLFHAVQQQKSTIVQLLLRYGADTALEDSAGLTPLHHAVLSGNLAMAELLLGHGAEPNAASNRSCQATPLLLCCKFEPSNRCNFLIFEALVLAGADTQRKDCFGKSIADHITANPRHELADSWDKLGIAPKLTHSSNQTFQDRFIETIRKGSNERLLDMLSEAGDQFDLDFETAGTKLSPLFYAVLGNRTDAVVTLLERGANPYKTDVAGNSPLYYALRLGLLEIGHILVDNDADVNQPNKVDCDRTLLMSCSMPGVIFDNKCDEQFVSFLIEAGANMQSYDCSGKTARDYAELWGNYAVLRVLDPSAVTARQAYSTKRLTLKSTTALAPSRNSSLSALILQVIRRPTTQKPVVQQFYTAEDLFEALRSGSLEDLRAVLASNRFNVATARDNSSGLNPFHFVLVSTKESSKIAVLRTLLHSTGNPPPKGLLHRAVISETPSLVQLLLHYGADPNEKVPMPIAGQFFSDDYIPMCEETPLMTCLENMPKCDEVIVRILLRFNASANQITNCRNMTALDLARRRFGQTGGSNKILQALQPDFQLKSDTYRVIDTLKEMSEYSPNELTITKVEPRGLRFVYARDDPRVVRIFIEFRTSPRVDLSVFESANISARDDDPSAPFTYENRNLQVTENYTIFYQLAAFFADGRKFRRGNMSWTYRVPQASESSCGIHPIMGFDNGTGSSPWNANLTLVFADGTFDNCSGVVVASNRILASRFCFLEPYSDLMAEVDFIKAELSDGRKVRLELLTSSAEYNFALLKPLDGFNLTQKGSAVNPVCLPLPEECREPSGLLVDCYLSGRHQDKIITSLLKAWLSDGDEMAFCKALQTQISSSALVCSVLNERSAIGLNEDDLLLNSIVQRIGLCFKAKGDEHRSEKVFNPICPAMDWLLENS